MYIYKYIYIYVYMSGREVDIANLYVFQKFVYIGVYVGRFFAKDLVMISRIVNFQNEHVFM